MPKYNDLVGKYVFARLRDARHSEWEKCKVLELLYSGIKVEARRTREQFIIASNDVIDDLRLVNAFLPYELEQKPYDGTFGFVCLVIFILL